MLGPSSSTSLSHSPSVNVNRGLQRCLSPVLSLLKSRRMSTSSATSDDVASSSSRSPPPTPSRRSWPFANSRPPPQDAVGVDPKQLIGKILKGIRRSPNHPCVTLYFADNTTFQIRIDGYDPRHRGIPKTLEADSGFEPYLNNSGDLLEVDFTVANAAKITMSDKAFDAGGRGSKWDQAHSGIALKFAEEGVWHCVWAQLAEYDSRNPITCTFRSYHDVYLDMLRQPTSRPHRRKNRKARQ